MRSKPVLMVLLAALAPACGGDDTPATADAGYDCSQDDRGEVFSAGMSKTGPAGYQVALADALPSPPRKNDNTWTVALTAPGGAAVTDESVAPLLCMPDHVHGTPIVATVTPIGEGTFTVAPLNLYMAGLWEITLLVRDGDSTEELPPACQPVSSALRLDEVQFRFCIDG
jgi:hypothetical protein